MFKSIILVSALLACAFGFSFPLGLQKNHKQELSNNRNLETLTITQRLDHFDRQGTATWNMRYFRNNQFASGPGGPIFIYIGGQYEFYQQAMMTSGLFFDLAQEMNGTLFATELRFYGSNRPTPDISTSSLRFLTTEQALADIAELISFIKSDNPGLENSRVVLFGRDYGGALATWARQKYPHLVDGVWASSAALLAQFDFPEYHENVANSVVNIGGLRCYRQLELAFLQLEDLIQANDFDGINSRFNFCNDIGIDESEFPHAYTLSGLALLFETLFELGEMEVVQDFCSTMNTQAEDALTLYANFINDFYAEFTPCIFIDQDTVMSSFNNTDWDGQFLVPDGRQYFYQICSEFSHFASSSSLYQPFGSRFPVVVFADACTQIFGPQFTGEFIESLVNRTNTIFGGLNPTVTNAFFTNGDLDPKRTLTILTGSSAAVVPGFSKSDIFQSVNSADPFFVEQVKIRGSNLVRGWAQN